MANQPRHLDVTTKDGIWFVRFTTPKILDEHAIHEIDGQLVELVKQHSPINLLLNFENVEYFSSAVLGMLIKLQKLVTTQSGQMKLSEIQPEIYKVFEITRLNEMFDFHDDTDAARASFTNG